MAHSERPKRPVLPPRSFPRKKRNALRAAVTRILDNSIGQFLYALDDAANTRDGLAITYDRKPLTTGSYEFGDSFVSWKTKTAHHGDDGAPNDKAVAT